MAYDPATDADKEEKFIGQLYACVKATERGMKPYRAMIDALIRDYTGDRYYGLDDQDPNFLSRPMNQLFSAMAVTVPLLASQSPRAQVEAQNGVPQWEEYLHAQVLDRQNKKRNVVGLIRSEIVNMIVGLGITYTNRHATGNGKTSIDSVNVPVADWIPDLWSRTYAEQQWEGYSVVVPLDSIKDGEGWQNTEDLVGDDEHALTEARKRHSRLPDYSERLRPMIQLGRFYLADGTIYNDPGPVIITIPLNQNRKKPIRIEPYPQELADAGLSPFTHWLIHEVPDNLLPVPPAAAGKDLDDTINTLARKARNQAYRHKRVALVTRGNEADGEAVRDAKDGDMLAVTDANSVKDVTIGSFDMSVFQALTYCLQQSSRIMGNIDQIGGLKAQNITATESNNLQENATARIADTKVGIYRAASQDQAKRAYWTRTDVNLREPAMFQSGDATDYVVMYSDHLEHRNGEVTPLTGQWADFEYGIVPRSMDLLLPQEKLKNLINILTIYGTQMQSIAQQGKTIDFGLVSDLISEYSDMPELDELIIEAPQMQQQLPTAQGAASMPSEMVPGAQGGAPRGAAPQPAQMQPMQAGRMQR